MARIKRSFTYQGKRYYADGATVQEAERNRERMKYELEHSIASPEKMRVDELAEMYWRRIQRKDLQPKTIQHKRHLLDAYILPVIGGMRVSDVKEMHVSMILDDAADKYTQDHVQKLKGMLRGMFQLARANRIIYDDPTEYVEPPVCRKKTAIRREATITERNTYLWHLPWLDMVICCGLRPGETARVRFQDIHDQYMFVDGTKNKNAKRFVPLPLQLHDELLEIPHDFDGDYICKMRDNKRSRQWLRLVDEIGLPPSDLEPYCFRHSYITDLENCAGLSQAQIKLIAGHAVPGITDRYTHIREQTAVDALPKLEAYWSSQGILISSGQNNFVSVADATL